MTIQRAYDSARGIPFRVRQRLRRGELVTWLEAATATGVEIRVGYKGPLDEAGLAMLLRVMARRVEKASKRIVVEG